MYCAGDPLADGTQCSAGTTCASAAVCKSSVCTPTGYALPGTPCDDHNTCTDPDTCDGAGKCLSGPLNDAPCDDGNVCTTGDHCGMVAINSTTFVPGCLGVPNSGVTCDDGDACTGDTLFGGTQDTCSSKSCLPGASETPFCKSWGQKYYSTNSGHCRSEDGACCTNFAKDKSGAIRGNCCLPKGLPCIGGGTLCCNGNVGNVTMTGTCSTPTGPAGSGVTGVCQ